MSYIHDFDDKQISWKFAQRLSFVLVFHCKNSFCSRQSTWFKNALWTTFLDDPISTNAITTVWRKGKAGETALKCSASPSLLTRSQSLKIKGCLKAFLSLTAIFHRKYLLKKSSLIAFFFQRKKKKNFSSAILRQRFGVSTEDSCPLSFSLGFHPRWRANESDSFKMHCFR